ncbi:MAG: polyphosphate kinase 2 family protein [Verrucomicrobiales bacterium]|jgi:PPK2 family polyphosphate:nucleotide phosphotransferase|nr:polyphosphate kinase 2 family protein [Verrucomicrobiales bacterium]
MLPALGGKVNGADGEETIGGVFLLVFPLTMNNHTRMNPRKFSKPYRVTDGKKFKLADFDPADTDGFKASGNLDEHVAKGTRELRKWQDKLYAQNRWSLLLIFQAMDAAGKDGTIKHVMSGVNPQGCHVVSFKSPSAEELSHDFMWRCLKNLPERGRIGIFNRSYYEETLIVRVHPEILANERLPQPLVSKNIWRERFEDITAYERYLSRNGVKILKFFLNVSPGEQKKRFCERLNNPKKHWKFSAADLAERQHWKQYMAAYEDMIRHTATRVAPWYVVPADDKQYAHLVVGAAVLDALRELDPAYPAVSREQLKRIKTAKKNLT